jgi:hypothetical protein
MNNLGITTLVVIAVQIIGFFILFIWEFNEIKKMKEKKIKFRDPVVEKVVDKFVSRSDVGFKKYGQTLDKERKTGVKDLSGYLNDVQEELMDAILYIQAAREELAEAKDKIHGNNVTGLPYYVSDIAS